MSGADRRQPLGIAEFQRLTGVSRETLDRLERYLACLERWQGAVNLVGPASLRDVWRRHFLDSAQLWAYLPSPAARVVDLGSGAGFPGLVLAILGAGDVHLIEANRRKAAFLHEAARRTGTAVSIHAGRIESMPSLAADMVTARGCAPLDKLLDLAVSHLRNHGYCVFVKGKTVDAELTEARKRWKMRISRFPSRSHPSGVVLKLEAVSRETS